MPTTKTGRDLDNDDIERMADDAEAGLDVSGWEASTTDRFGFGVAAMPTTRTALNVLDHWEDAAGPDPELVAALAKIEKEAEARLIADIIRRLDTLQTQVEALPDPISRDEVLTAIGEARVQPPDTPAGHMVPPYEVTACVFGELEDGHSDAAEDAAPGAEGPTADDEDDALHRLYHPDALQATVAGGRRMSTDEDDYESDAPRMRAQWSSEGKAYAARLDAEFEDAGRLDGTEVLELERAPASP